MERAAAPRRLPPRWSVLGLPIGLVLVWQAVALALVVVASARPSLLPGAAGGGAAVVGATLLRHRGQWLYQWLGRRARFAARGRRRSGHRSAGQGRPGPLGLPGLSGLLPELEVSTVAGRRGKQIGMVRDGWGWVAVVEVSAGDDVLPARQPVPTLPVARLADLLTVDDIRLAGVQLVVHTVPAAARSAGPPAPAVAAMWVALRLDPMLAPEVLAGQAGGVEAMHRAVRRCTERVTEMFATAGLAAAHVEEAALREVFALSVAPPATADAIPPQAVERWDHWEYGAVHVGYEVREWPPDGLASLLDALREVPALSVVLAVTFGGADGRAARFTGTVRVTSVDTEAAQAADRALAQSVHSRGGRVRRLDGRHAAAVVATLPLGGGRR